MQLNDHELEQMIDLFSDHTTQEYADNAKAQVRRMIEHDSYFPMEGLLEERCDPDLDERVWANRAAAAMALYLEESDPDMQNRVEEHLEFTGYTSLCGYILFSDICDPIFYADAGKTMLACLNRHNSRKGKVHYALAAFSSHCPKGFDMRKAIDFLEDDALREQFCCEADNICDQQLVRQIIRNAKATLTDKYFPTY